MIQVICCMVIAVCCLVMAGNLDRKLNDVIQAVDSYKAVLIALDSKFNDLINLLSGGVHE